MVVILCARSTVYMALHTVKGFILRENLQSTRLNRKEKEKDFVPSVTQKLGGIIQKNTFIAEDIKPLDEKQDDKSAEDDAEEWTVSG